MNKVLHRKKNDSIVKFQQVQSDGFLKTYGSLKKRQLFDEHSSVIDIIFKKCHLSIFKNNKLNTYNGLPFKHARIKRVIPIFRGTRLGWLVSVPNTSHISLISF